MKRISKITILGNGSFGTALAHAASFNPHNRVVIYCRNIDNANHINEKRRNPKFFTTIELNANVSATSNF